MILNKLFYIYKVRLIYYKIKSIPKALMLARRVDFLRIYKKNILLLNLQIKNCIIVSKLYIFIFRNIGPQVQRLPQMSTLENILQWHIEQKLFNFFSS